ncbi:MAG TPA: hypothetical protein VIK27_13220 [Candidatus Aquilonibacter sp.]
MPRRFRIRNSRSAARSTRPATRSPWCSRAASSTANRSTILAPTPPTLALRTPLGQDATAANAATIGSPFNVLSGRPGPRPSLRATQLAAISKDAGFSVNCPVAQFNPYDGYDSHAGIAGYGIYGAHIWNPGGGSKIAAIGIDGFLDRYQGTQIGGVAQSDNALGFDLLTKSAWDFQLMSGSDYWRFGPTLTPISQNGGFSITYRSGLQTDNPGNFPAHGSSATPTQLQYFTGRYGDGRLDTWYRTTTIRVGNRGSLSLAVDNTAQWLYGKAPDNIQWFDSASYTYQISRNSSLAIGVRRIVGMPPDPNGGGNCEGVCSNVSLAYHLRLNDYEFYIAYGDPNTLLSVPQAIFKVIFYAGAQKGT